MNTRIGRWSALALAALALSGCAAVDGTPRAAQLPPTSSNPVQTPTTSPAVTTTVDPQPDPPYSIYFTRTAGSTDRVQYDVSLPQITGPNAAVVQEFNESMESALQDQVDGFEDARFTLTDGRPGPSHIGSEVISAVLLTTWDANPPGAHPSPLIATVTINSLDAQPVTLQDLFPDIQAGLERLSSRSALLLPGTAAGADFNASGIEPRIDNFANWYASPNGMNIRFSDYQVGPHAIGLVDVTVPWSDLADVADPSILDVLSS